MILQAMGIGTIIFFVALMGWSMYMKSKNNKGDLQ